MSSPLLPTSDRPGPTTPTSSGSILEDEFDVFLSELTPGRPPEFGAAASHPPLDVLEQIADAGARQQELSEQGQELRFSVTGSRERVSIVLTDASGKVCRNVSIVEAFAIAAGKPLE